MKVTSFTRKALAVRREERSMLRAGWERVGEGGGRLWELVRGGRFGSRIVDARVAEDGVSLWVRIEKGGT